MRHKFPEVHHLNEIGFNASYLLSRGFAFITENYAISITNELTWLRFPNKRKLWYRLHEKETIPMITDLQLVTIVNVTMKGMSAVINHEISFYAYRTPTLGRLFDLIIKTKDLSFNELVDYLGQSVFLKLSYIKDRPVISGFSQPLFQQKDSTSLDHSFKQDGIDKDLAAIINLQAKGDA